MSNISPKRHAINGWIMIGGGALLLVSTIINPPEVWETMDYLRIVAVAVIVVLGIHRLRVANRTSD